MSQENEAWIWHSDTQGRINSVSSSFTSTFGTSVAKEIIGNFFWTFAERLDKPSNGWIELDNAFKNSQKFTKFIFHYQTQSQEKIKIAISGEPIFDKGKYTGFTGIGYTAHKSEISIPEITQNMLSLCVENLDIGLAIFSPEVGLLEFNQSFELHLYKAKIKAIRNIRYDTILSSLKFHCKYYSEISSDIDDKDLNIAHYYFETQDDVLICIKKNTLGNGFIVLKTDIDKSILQNIKVYEESFMKIKEKNNLLETRIQDYKNNLSTFFNKQEHKTKEDSDFKKMLSFFESNIDVGIFITDTHGKIESVNFALAQMFGFVTVLMLKMNHNNDIDFSTYLKHRQERIKDLLENQINRFEHIFQINNYIYKGNTKEVIIFYPSIHNPQKVISLFYPENKIENPDNNNSNDAKQTDSYLLEINQHFVNYIANDIKNIINVIEGYNDLQGLKPEITDIDIYRDHISLSCNAILHSISNIMQVSKISSDTLKLEKSVFLCQDIIEKCLDNLKASISDNKIHLNIELKTNGLLIISDKTLFYNALFKILDILVHSSEQGTKLKIKIIDDVILEKIQIIIIDESKINIENIIRTDAQFIFKQPKLRYTGSINFKIAEHYFKLLNCKFFAVYHEDRGNVITIEISGDMITSHNECDSNNLVI